MAQKSKKNNNTNSLRIIGGLWRGRKLSFPSIDGLRPTSDRIRETVFNWLAPIITESRCLDLFAGSGALGFEAASRGAASVVMVEADARAYQQLKQHQQLLTAQQCELYLAQAQTVLAQLTGQFDVVFIDPPYQAQLWTNIAQQLTRQQLLRHEARIYLEYPRQQGMPALPESWVLLREKRAGDVVYCLFAFQEP